MATALASISISHAHGHAKQSAMSIQSSIKPSTVATAASAPSASVTGNHDGVRVVGIHEYREAAACLADAFKDDHTTRYFLDTPDSVLTEQEKWDLHVSMMEYITYAHCLKGLVTTVGDFDAVALWLPPGQNIDDLLTILRSGLWRLKYKLTPEGRIRFFNEFLPLLGESKSRVMGARDTDSWYLVYIGTHSRARGNGCAKKLITQVTALADAEGKACYLESSNEINPKIYAKYGFEIKRKVWLQRDGDHVVELDLMVREPKGKRNSFLEKESAMRNERL